MPAGEEYSRVLKSVDLAALNGPYFWILQKTMHEQITNQKSFNEAIY